MQRERDQTALTNYQLGNAARTDPYRTGILANQLANSNMDTATNRQFYNEGGPLDILHSRQQEMRAQLDHLKQQIAMGLVPYGIPQPLIQNTLSNYPGATVGSEGISFPVSGANGTQYNVNTPYGQVTDPNRVRNEALIDYRNANLGLGEQRVGVQQQRADQAGNRYPGTNPINGTTFLHGINDGTATGAVNTTPSTGSMLPYQDVDAQRQYRQQLGTPRSAGGIYGF